MQIKVLGPGCTNCKKLYKLVQDAVKELGRDDEIIYVTDMAEIAMAGVMRTPALIMDGQVKISGRVPKLEEIKALLNS
ncbi:MAG TPA: redox-active disulfide protein 2 [Firmicutes bacterium]|jgi:small redox-active disulfide protein 2|nr:redox-active disulfide protein 2 [Bacillota bacterium]